MSFLRNRGLTAAVVWLGIGGVGLSGAESASPVLVEFRQQVECMHPTKILVLSNGVELPFETTVRTGEKAAALVRLSDATLLRVHERTELQLFDPDLEDKPWLELLRGAFLVHSRSKTGGVRVRIGKINAVSSGTDFEVSSDGTGQTFRVFDGSLSISNEIGWTNAGAGWQVTVLPGSPPRAEPIVVPDLVQWWLRYPVALDTAELRLTDAERLAFGSPLLAWEQGDVRAAIVAWTNGLENLSPAGRILAGAVELAAGHPDRAGLLLTNLPGNDIANGPLAVLAAVSRRPWGTDTADSASAWLGLSWWRQSRHDLGGALAAAREATRRSPQWGMGWARQAELEFSSGETRRAEASLRRAIQFAPRSASAHALRGFVLAAQERRTEALAAFDTALQIDGLLGDAWLGRGLCLIQQGRGREPEGRLALQNAVGAEAGRAVLRSYLGKAFDLARDSAGAAKEFDYAKRLDPGDPTPWLYSALLMEQEHRYNEAVRDLEQSMALNENRAVYRSQLLLDQDRAVRGANLARIFDRAGLEEVGAREAARSANLDYANWASHLFLAESYDALRDPARVNLRYETPWFNELLLARLLAPAAAGAFSQNLSEQEYGRLFESDRTGLNTSTEWRSDGRWRERATGYGVYGRTSWAVDLDWEHREEQDDLNNGLSRLEIYPQLKQQVTAADSLLLFAKIYDYEAGDVRQLEDPQAADRTLQISVSQLPIAAAGWHHEWAPGIHTLLLGARLEDEQRVQTQQLGALGFYQPFLDLPPASAQTEPLALRYAGQLEIWSGELNQIVQAGGHTFVAGTRVQQGEFETSDSLRTNGLTGANASSFNNPAAATQTSENFSRFSIYGYDHYEVLRGLLLIGGVAYDRVEVPRNFAAPPISSGTRTVDAVLPKGGLVWTPTRALTLRAMYAQSLGGASFDESLRLEPSQIAGFPQSYRSLLSESAGGGGGSVQHFELLGAAADLRLARHTWLGLEGARRTSDEANTIGAFRLGAVGNYEDVSIAEARDYEETAMGLSLHQMLGDGWGAGTGWRFMRSEREVRHPLFPESFGSTALAAERADMNQLWFRLVFNHWSGFFARAEFEQYWQESTPRGGASRQEAVGLLNLFAGWRFARRGELGAGVLNVTDQSHRLNPLTPLAELPQERVFVARMRLNF